MKTRTKAALLALFTLGSLLLHAAPSCPRDALTASAQTPQTPAAVQACPNITIECPDTVQRPGTPITFSVQVSGLDPISKLTFNWVVSAGTIAQGQTTTDIEVDTTGLTGNQEVTAEVEVGGLHRVCESKAACTTVVLRPFEPHPLDSYGNIEFEDEQARLDNFAIELQNTPQLNGYLVCYGGRRGRRGEAAARCERAKNYLVNRRGLDPGRLVLVDGGFQERLSVFLWLLPPDTNFPPSPTVNPSEVEFTNAPKTRTKRPARRRAGRTATRQLT